MRGIIQTGRKTVVFVLGLILFYSSQAQSQKYNSAIVAFYNLENLYDTIDNPSTDDEDFLPNSPKAYTSKVYREKIQHLATVISQIGTDFNRDGPAILGVAEVENDTVLNDLILHPLLSPKNYRYIHYDAQDPRGVDVALLYNPKYFQVLSSKPLYVPLPGNSKTATHTRDILWVTGLLNGERVEVFVNHWPSRYGGEKKSMPARIAAAKVARNIIDPLLKQNPKCKILLMGDLNDDPVNESITRYLGTGPDPDHLGEGVLYNPWVSLYKKGQGSLAYQDAWSLFDQIILSQAWLDKTQKEFFFFQNDVFKKSFMIENKGRYKGYPMRTYSGDAYRGGYSDHFPTYILLLRKIE